MGFGITAAATDDMLKREDALFPQRDPLSQDLNAETAAHRASGRATSRIQLALMRGVLQTYFTAEVFETLIRFAERLERGIADVIIKHGVAWHVVRIGARV